MFLDIWMNSVEFTLMFIKDSVFVLVMCYHCNKNRIPFTCEGVVSHCPNFTQCCSYGRCWRTEAGAENLRFWLSGRCVLSVKFGRRVSVPSRMKWLATFFVCAFKGWVLNWMEEGILVLRLYFMVRESWWKVVFVINLGICRLYAFVVIASKIVRSVCCVWIEVQMWYLIPYGLFGFRFIAQISLKFWSCLLYIIEYGRIVEFKVTFLSQQLVNPMNSIEFIFMYCCISWM